MHNRQRNILIRFFVTPEDIAEIKRKLSDLWTILKKTGEQYLETERGK